MTVYLVRHADAKSRSRWRGPDEERPLTKRGERQANGLVRLLEHAKVGTIHSSPAVRCVETVSPLGRAAKVRVKRVESLREGAELRSAMQLLSAQLDEPGDAVLCAHGDLIPEMLLKLARDGVALDGGEHCAKGSTWELDVVEGRVVAGRYHPPPG